MICNIYILLPCFCIILPRFCSVFNKAPGDNVFPDQFQTVRHCPQRLISPFFTFLHAIFFRPFRLSLAHTICPWVSEDGNNLARAADKEKNGPGLWEFAGKSGSESAKTAYWGLRYINILTTKILLQKTTTVSSGDIHTHTRELWCRRLDPTVDT